MLFPPDLTTEEVIAILQQEGYTVTRPNRAPARPPDMIPIDRNRILEIGTQRVIDDHDFARVSKDRREAIYYHTRRDCATDIGLTMLKKGALAMEQLRDDYNMQTITRIRARVILPLAKGDYR